MAGHFLFEMLRLMRPQQWVKNGFVLAPYFFAATHPGARELLPLGIATLVFCLVSSAVYIFNDWRDLEADRDHAYKRRRPLPSGTVSSSAALTLMGALVVCAGVLALAARLPSGFLAVMTIYVAVNLAYSLGLKQVSVVEMFLVASGFLLRLVGGAVVLGIDMSPWIIIATGMIAMLLTAGKRRSDLALVNHPDRLREPLRRYTLPYLDSVVAALTGGTLVVYLLFCASDYAQARYGWAVIFTAIPVSLGLVRFQQVLMVENGGESPTDLVLSDPFILSVIVIFVAMFAALIYL